jgi:carboxylesterase type B
MLAGQRQLRQPYMMKWPQRQAARDLLPSERGYFEMAEHRSDLSTSEALVAFRALVSSDMDWADSRKSRFRKYASRVRVWTLILTAASTVVLGVEVLPSRSSIALPMVAAVTVLSALEPFFNWRSRWVLMEETQYRLNRIRDEMDLYLVTTRPEDMQNDQLHKFYQEQQKIWADVSRRWIEFRKLDQPPQAAQPASPAGGS